MNELKPCPFCGAVGLDFSEGSTFRWRIAECTGCGASTGEERIQTMGEGTQEEWEANCRQRLIEVWNRRATPAINATGRATTVQDVMWEVFDYAKLMDGFSALEGQEREERRNAALAQEHKIRSTIAAATGRQQQDSSYVGVPASQGQLVQPKGDA